MQSNNKMRVFSGEATNVLTDAELDSEIVKDGAISESIASSKLYNSLSKSTTNVTTAIADFIASQNPSIEIGQNTSIDDMITATNNTFASKSSTQNAINNLSTNIQNGTIVAKNSTNADISNKSINDSDGNPINTTYAKNQDFSASTPTTFGDYTISKKITLWEGSSSVTLTTGNTTKFDISLPTLIKTHKYGAVFYIMHPNSIARYMYTYEAYPQPQTDVTPTLEVQFHSNIPFLHISNDNYVREITISYYERGDIGAQLNTTDSSTGSPTVTLTKIYEIIE